MRTILSVLIALLVLFAGGGTGSTLLSTPAHSVVKISHRHLPVDVVHVVTSKMSGH